MTTSTMYHSVQEHHVRNEGKPASAATATPYRDKVATAIYATTEYGQFKIDSRNRPIDQNKVIRLYDAISEKDMLADNPILVDSEFVVLDGQHRLKAAEALGVSIYYHFAGYATIDDVPTLNNKRSAWKMTDYLRSWCERGNSDYITLRDFMGRYPWMMPQVAASLCYYGDRLDLRTEFPRGRYIANNVDFAERVAQALLDFKSSGFVYWNSRVFVSAVTNLMANADYDHARMLAKLRYNPRGLQPAVNTEDYFAIFTDLYNYKERKDNHVLLRKLGSADAKYRAERKAMKR